MAENINGATAQEEVNLAEQAQIRREKLAKLTEEGKNPFVKVKWQVSAGSEKIKNNFDTYVLIVSYLVT